MTATAYTRGHLVYFDEISGEWFYSDNDDPITRERPCTKCNEMPTSEGYDACLGYVEGVTSACCGHGVESPYVMWDWRARPFRWFWDRLKIELHNRFQRIDGGGWFADLGVVILIFDGNELEVVTGAEQEVDNAN